MTRTFVDTAQSRDRAGYSIHAAFPSLRAPIDSDRS